MISLTIQLDDSIAESLRQMARARNCSESDLTQEAIACYVQKPSRVAPKGVGAYHSGRADVSENAGFVQKMEKDDLFNLIKTLYNAQPLSKNKQIAAELGRQIRALHPKLIVPSDSSVRTLINLARLPKFVQDEYRKLMRHGKNRTNVRWSHVDALIRVYINGRRKGFVTEPSPEFMELWRSILNPYG